MSTLSPAVPFQRRTGICLNMIVKNETPVIERLLRSVRTLVDYFVIVDTGSTDGTPELILRLAQEFGLAGEVHRRDWINFGHNRQQALELAVAAARGDWLLIIDADEELAYSDPEFFRQLQPGVTYELEKHHDDTRYALPNLIDIRHSRWAWRGPVHEYLECLAAPLPRQRRSDAWILFHVGEGARSRGLTQREKFLRDANLLEVALATEPQHARNRFYLAQSYRDAGEFSQALDQYQQRVALGGWAEEVYVAQCEKAKLTTRLNWDHRDILAEHLAAYSLRPSRAEALWQLAAYCRERQKYAEGYLFAKVGKDIPVPADRLFLRLDVYQWRLLDEWSICAYWIGQYQESADAGDRLLAEKRFPDRERPRIESNLAFAKAKLRA